MHMYLEHFKLKEFPYLSAPDARFLYLSDQVNEALQKCLYTITNRIGPLYVFGPIGTGKTTLATRLSQQLGQQPKSYIISYIVVPPRTTLNAFLRMIMSEFDLKPERAYTDSLNILAK